MRKLLATILRRAAMAAVELAARIDPYTGPAYWQAQRWTMSEREYRRRVLGEMN